MIDPFAPNPVKAEDSAAAFKRQNLRDQLRETRARMATADPVERADLATIAVSLQHDLLAVDDLNRERTLDVDAKTVETLERLRREAQADADEHLRDTRAAAAGDLRPDALNDRLRERVARREARSREAATLSGSFR